MRWVRVVCSLISPSEFRGIGSMQYRQTLPLNDHEVVITFDDGPLPPYSNIILDTLASQCVKATYFLIGRMAHQYPSIVRRIYNAGHTIGTHTENHPLALQRLPLQRVGSRSRVVSLRSMPPWEIRRRCRRFSEFRV